MTPFNILILAGHSGAGKTSIARQMSKDYDLGFIEHQKLIHEMAISKGYLRTRHWLKEVGIKSFVDESKSEMYSRLESFRMSGLKGVVIDVAYGNDMVTEISSRFSDAKVIVISVCTNEAIRETRIMSRMGGVERTVAYDEREFRDGFLNDVGLREVIDNADFEIINNGDLRDTIGLLYKNLEERGIQLKT